MAEGVGVAVAEGVAPTDGVAAAEGVAVRERAGFGVTVGDTELVGVVVDGAVVWVGPGEVEACPVVEGLPTVAAWVGLKST